MTSSWCRGTETDPSEVGTGTVDPGHSAATDWLGQASAPAPGASLIPLNRGRTLPRTAGVVRFSALRGRSSDGRASAFQAECRRFEPGLPLNFIVMRYFFILFFITNLLYSQSENRTWIRGKVLYKNSNVISANVVNNTSRQATITDDEGEFEMLVKLNDRLVFSSVQYQIRSVIVNKEILQKSRLIIDVNEKVTVLDEVVVGPENTEKFLDLKEEEFKRTYYNFDKSSKVENQILKAGTFNNGLNFINLYKMIAKSSSKSGEIDKQLSNVNYKPSNLIREVYDDAFFVKNLGLKKQNISEFLLFCDDKFPSKFLFKKSNEFQLLDFLIKQSDKFKKVLERS